MTDQFLSGTTEPELADDNWGLRSYEESNSSFSPIPEGKWTLEITEIAKPTPVQERYQNEEGTKVQSQFTLTVVETDEEDEDGPVAGRTMRCWYTLSMNEKSKLYKEIASVIFPEIDPAKRYTPADFIGARFTGTIIHAEREKDGRTRVYANLAKTAPLGGSKSARKSRV